MAKQLEAVLNRPNTMMNDTEKKEETPIEHTTVDMSNETPETEKISYGGGSRRKKAHKKFQED